MDGIIVKCWVREYEQGESASVTSGVALAPAMLVPVPGTESHPKPHPQRATARVTISKSTRIYDAKVTLQITIIRFGAMEGRKAQSISA